MQNMHKSSAAKSKSNSSSQVSANHQHFTTHAHSSNAPQHHLTAPAHPSSTHPAHPSLTHSSGLSQASSSTHLRSASSHSDSNLSQRSSSGHPHSNSHLLNASHDGGMLAHLHSKFSSNSGPEEFSGNAVPLAGSMSLPPTVPSISPNAVPMQMPQIVQSPMLMSQIHNAIPSQIPNLPQLHNMQGFVPPYAWQHNYQPINNTDDMEGYAPHKPSSSICMTICIALFVLGMVLFGIGAYFVVANTPYADPYGKWLMIGSAFPALLPLLVVSVYRCCYPDSQN